LLTLYNTITSAALLLLVANTIAHAENYESCLIHPSEAYLKIFKTELDKNNIANISIVTGGKQAICVLPKDEEAVLKISKQLAKNKI